MFNPADHVLVTKIDEMDDRHVNICLGNKILATVCEPSGPGGGMVYGVWIGDGLNENDEEATPIKLFHSYNHQLDGDRAWLAAVKCAYQLALDFWSKEPLPSLS